MKWIVIVTFTMVNGQHEAIEVLAPDYDTCKRIERNVLIYADKVSQSRSFFP